MFKMILQIGVHNQAIWETSAQRSAGAQDPLRASASPMENEKQGTELRGALQNTGKISEIQQGLSQAGSCSEDVSPLRSHWNAHGQGGGWGRPAEPLVSISGATIRHKLCVFCLQSTHLKSVCIVL